MAMAISILSGGLDLSVGAVFAMANFLTLYLMQLTLTGRSADDRSPYSVGAR